MKPADVGRTWRTVVHLRPSQVWHRARLSARRALWSRQPGRIDARYRARAEPFAGLRFDDPGLAALAALRAARRDPAQALAAARGALAGRFTFLGETRELGAPPAWDRADLMQAMLWKTHLHEFGLAFELALAFRSSGDGAFREGFFALARDWLAGHPIGGPGFARVAWNERVVATRLLHWAVSGARLGLDAGEAAWLSREIARHALFLRDNLALDLLANHLFRDCAALAVAEALLPGVCPDALGLLEREVRAQILPDGCHVERCPMYHAVCLQDLIDVHAVLGAEAPAWLGDAIARAGGFLDGMRLGDGDIALLGDGWRGEADAGKLVEQATARAGALVAPVEPHSSSGLLRLARGPWVAVVRAGPHGPDYQLGHAHADLLSFELSRGTARVVVDTGTGAYAASPLRTRLRSTAAHNTIGLDGEELLEAWSSFRSGRRGRARVRARGVASRFEWLWASHDAYAWLAGRPIHHRLLAVGENAVLVVDAMLGAGRHRIASHLHLHPEAPAGLRVVALGAAAGRRSAPYHERFNQTREMPELFVEASAALPWVGGWWICGDDAAPSSAAVSRAGDVIGVAIAAASGRVEVRWHLDASGPGAVVVGEGP